MKPTVGIALLLVVLLIALAYWIQKNTPTNNAFNNLTTMQASSSASSGVTIQKILSSETLEADNFTYLPNDYSWQYVVFLPPGYNASKTYPMIIGMHGEGGVALDYINDWKAAATTYNFILAFPQSNSSVWWTGTASEFTTAIIQEMKANYKIGDIFLTGCSAGAKTTYSTALWNPGVFTGIAPMASSFGTYTPTNQDLQSAQGQKFYVVQGSNDPLIPLSNTEHAVSTLRNAGAHVTFIVVQGMGHACPVAEDMNITRWFVSLEPGT